MRTLDSDRSKSRAGRRRMQSIDPVMTRSGILARLRNVLTSKTTEEPLLAWTMLSVLSQLHVIQRTVPVLRMVNLAKQSFVLLSTRLLILYHRVGE
jgi:hypothetical protein